MKRVLPFVLAVAALATGCVSTPKFTCTPLKNVTMPAGSVLIDTRTQKEYDERHIDGAVLVPHDKIVERIAGIVPDRTTPLYLYCGTGRRAEKARKALNGLGYGNVVNLCGIDAAKAALKK